MLRPQPYRSALVPSTLRAEHNPKSHNACHESFNEKPSVVVSFPGLGLPLSAASSWRAIDLASPDPTDVLCDGRPRTPPSAGRRLGTQNEKSIFGLALTPYAPLICRPAWPPLWARDVVGLGLALSLASSPLRSRCCVRCIHTTSVGRARGDGHASLHLTNGPGRDAGELRLRLGNGLRPGGQVQSLQGPPA